MMKLKVLHGPENVITAKADISLTDRSWLYWLLGYLEGIDAPLPARNTMNQVIEFLTEEHEILK